MRISTFAVLIGFLPLTSLAATKPNPYPNIVCRAIFEDDTLVEMTPIVDQEDNWVMFKASQGDVRIKVDVYEQLGGQPQPACQFEISDPVRDFFVSGKGVFDPTNQSGLGYGCYAAIGTNGLANKWIQAFCINTMPR